MVNSIDERYNELSKLTFSEYEEIKDEFDSDDIYLIEDEDLIEVFVENSLDVKNKSYVARKVIGIAKNINDDINSQMFVDILDDLIKLINKVDK